MTQALSQAPAPRSQTGAGASHFRLDIQGLRTIAVGAVVLFHLWPLRLAGGFVGVDVFFVISGFLITGHLLREVNQTGSIRLGRFWSRRIARLLPDSFLVLLVVAVATFVIVPKDQWTDYFSQIRASALYFENWQLAWDSVDYMAMDSQPTAVQHYWSLSVEEQFYAVWPLLIVLALFVVKRFAPMYKAHTVLLILLSAVVAASLWYSIVATNRQQSWAYFASFTRVWEFAAGGIVALTASLVGRQALGSLGTALAGWMGVALIIWSAFAYSGATMFPGYAALIPVVGTMLVLYFGNSTSSWSPRTFLSLRPMVWIGGISYAVYLWHWPLVVMVPFVTGHQLTTVEKLAIGVVTLVLAQASTRLVEDPMRRGRLLGVPARAFAFAIVGAVIFVSITAVGSWQLARAKEAAELAVAERAGQPCIGPSALDPTNGCGDPMGTGEYLITPEVVAAQNEDVPFKECQAGGSQPTAIKCELGVDPQKATRHLALVGDSHATHWAPGFDEVANARGWTVDTFFKSSCPLVLSRRGTDLEKTREAGDSCEVWSREVLTRILRSDADTVVLSSYQSAYTWNARDDGLGSANPVEGFATVFEQIADSGKEVVVIKAIPRTFGSPVPGCLVENGRSAESCGLAREEALPDDQMEQAVQMLDRPDVRLVNLDDQFCDSTWCYPVVGDVVVYRDYSHLAPNYAKLLMPWVLPTLEDTR